MEVDSEAVVDFLIYLIDTQTGGHRVRDGQTGTHSLREDATDVH